VAAIPSRTDSERAEALAKALQTRQERARLRAALRDREIAPADVVLGAEGNPLWASLRVSWLLESVPGVGPVRAQQMMTSLAIASSRRIQGLGARQRAALLEELGRRG
jgi:hypothetical protein